jgi:hypothetical protein
MRHSPVSLRSRIEAVLTEVQKAQMSATPHPFLPVVGQSLEKMKKNVRAKQLNREKMAGALGRIVTEDDEFAESELGSQILDVVNEFADASED